MSDTTETPTPDASTAPASQPQPADPVGVAMRSLQEDNRRLDGDLKAALAKLGERETEATTLRAQVDGYGKAQREAAIVGKLRNVLPHATEFEVRGVLAGMHEAGKVDRYSDKADEAAAAAFELIKVEAPSLTRAPTSGGGTPGARAAPPARTHKSLI